MIFAVINLTLWILAFIGSIFAAFGTAAIKRERDLYRETLTKLCAAGFGYDPDRDVK